MKTRDPETVRALCDALSEVAQLRGIVAAYVFGSVARGTSRERSDVDVALLFGGAPPKTLGATYGIEGELEQAVGRPVQVVVLDRAPVDLIHRVLRDGVLVFEADRSARVRFETRARAEYLDLAPFIRRYRRSGDAA